MSIRSRVRSAWGTLKAAGEAFAMKFPRSGMWRWFMPRTKLDYAREVGEGFGSSVIMAPVLWIMRTFPEAPPVLIRDDETIKDHDMLELIRRPNEFYSGHLLAMGTVLSFVLNGNGYWLVETDATLKPWRLWYIPHTMMKPVWPNDGSVFISHYEYSPQGAPIAIPRENVIHFRYGLDPQNMRLGLSPLATLLREVFTDDEAANFSAALLRNSGVPGLIVGPDWQHAGAGTAISPEDKQDVKDYFKDNTTGDHRGEPMVFTAPTKIEQFGFSPKDLDLSMLRRVPEERVTACLGIPAAVVGLGSGLAQTKVGATMKELREMAYESGIIPMQRLFAEEIGAQLLPLYEPDPKSWEVGYDLTKVRILQEDQTALTGRMTTLVESRQITVAESRQRQGWETGPEHEIYLQKFSTIVVPAGGSAEAAVEATAPAAPLPVSTELAREAEALKRQRAELLELGVPADNLLEVEQLSKDLATFPNEPKAQGGNGGHVDPRIPGRTGDNGKREYVIPIDKLREMGITDPKMFHDWIRTRSPGKGHLKAAVPADILAAFLEALLKDEDLLSGPFARELTTRFLEYGDRAAEIFLELFEAGEIPGVLDGGPEVDAALAARMILVRSKGADDQEQINAALAELKAAGDPPEIEMAVGKILARLDQEFDKPAILGYGPQYLKVAAATIETVETVLGIAANLPDPIEAAVFDAAGKRMGLVDLSGQTTGRLFEIIKEARDLGEGPRQMALRIKDEIPRGPWPDARTRGLVISRTETKYAQNVSTIATYQNVDGVNAVQVVDAQKGPTDEYCEEMNGRVVSFADAQVLADTEHPNGTRSFAPLFGESPPIESIETEEAFEARTE